MKRASVSQIKNQHSALLDQVRQGETVVITDHERPLGPIAAVAASEAADGRIRGLERKCLVRRGGGPNCEPVVPLDGASALGALLEERIAGR
jgi:antitoxin (DNA-binding transcriptional repressor) of toxin-antitoxin stability system